MKDEEFYKSLGSALRQEREKQNLSHHIVQNANTAVLITDHAAMFVSTY